MLNNLKATIKGTVIYGLGSLSIKLVGFVLLPLYTKFLPVADYGVLALVESLSQIVVTVFSCNITLALFRWYWDPRYVEKQKSIFFTVLIFSLFIAVILLLSAGIYTADLSNMIFGKPEQAKLILLMFFFSALEIVIAVPASLLRLQEKVGLYTATQIVRLLINLIFTAVLLIYIYRSVESIYIAQIIGSILYLLLLVPYIVKNIEVRLEIQILKDMLRYSLPTVISTISVIIVSFAERYILKYFCTLADVGVYSLGYRIANIILFVVMSIQMAIAPLIYKAIDRPEGDRFFSKVMTYLAFSIMFLVIGTSFFGREMVKTLARNPEYWNAYQVIPFLAFGIFFYTIKEMANTGLVITRKTKTTALITFLMAILNILLDIIIIPYFKSIGVAIATGVTQICFFFVIYYFSQKAHYINYENIKILKITLLGIVLVIISQPLNQLNVLVSIPIKTLLLFSYPFLLYYFGFYETIELVRAEQAWQKWKHVKNWKKYIIGR